MRTRTVVIAMLALGTLLMINPVGLCAEQTETPEERARKILREVDDLWRGDSSHGIFTMQVTLCLGHLCVTDICNPLSSRTPSRFCVIYRLRSNIG